MDVTPGPYNKFPYAFITARYQTDQGNRSLLGFQVLLLRRKK